jgi:hypothetical protein
MTLPNTLRYHVTHDTLSDQEVNRARLLRWVFSLGVWRTLRITAYDDGQVFVLERIDASAESATYYVDLSAQAGIDLQMTLTFSSSTTLGGQLSGCPNRGGQGYLIEARDEPSEGTSGGQSSTGLVEDCSIALGPGLSEADLDELVACFEPFAGAFIVEGLPDVDGVYYTRDGLTQGYGGDPLDFGLDMCAVSEGVFMTDTATELGQVTLGVQDGDNRLMTVVRQSESGISHNYLPVALTSNAVIDIRSRQAPSENPWAGWAIFRSTMYNEADFFPYTDTAFEGEPSYGARITIVCG